LGDTKIEWATKTWNPLRGCSKVSEGCRNCYAIRVAHRFGGPGQPYEGLTQTGPGGPNWTGKVTLVPDALELPLNWRKPQRVFVNSMSDLFHPEVPDDFIHQVWETMAAAAQHTFQILTKRPERMRDWVRKHGNVVGTERPALTNVWLGVSVEDQKAADERIPLLLQTPAAVRFLSCEPLLGPVNLKIEDGFLDHDVLAGRYTGPNGETDIHMPTERIDWIIVGGESGPKARSADPDWFRSLHDQCQAAGVAFFFKQWGEWLPVSQGAEPVSIHDCTVGKTETYLDDQFVRVGKKAAGRQLDGREWNEFPEVRR
jgi:protein gp37